MEIYYLFKCNSSCWLFIYRPNDSKESITLDLQLYSFAFAGIFMGMYNIVLQVPFTGYTKWDWTVFLLLAVVPTVSHVINNWLLNYVNATTISMSILGEPVGASILAFFLLGERLNAMQMIGSMLVLFGVSVFLLQQQNEQQKDMVNEPAYTQEL